MFFKCKMSDLHDDLLNYELGDGEELDEQTLLVGDEDDLLLSDEELEKDKTALKEEAEEWVSSKLISKEENAEIVEKIVEKIVEEIPPKQPEEVTTTTTSTSTACSKEIDIEMYSPHQSSDKNTATKNNSESDVSTSGDSPVKLAKTPPLIKPVKEIEKQTVEKLTKAVKDVSVTKTDEVTSTNKEVEVDSAGSLARTYNIKEDVLISSQESSNIELSTDHDPREDFEEQQQRGERRNIKHASERDDNADSSPEKVNHGGGRYLHSKRGGRGGMRGHFPGQRPLLQVRYPHLNYSQYPHHPNENINPQQAPPNQFPPPHQYHLHEHPGVNNSMPPRQQFHPQNNINNGPRMEFRPNFRPQNPNEFNNAGGGMFNPRGPRPDFHNQNHPSGLPYNNFPHPQNNMRPMFRPDMHNMRPRMPLRPQSSGGMQPMQSNLSYSAGAVQGLIGQQHSQHHSHPSAGGQQPHGVNLSSTPTLIVSSVSLAPSITASVLPRKVLINPNFKGGVEAATNQLMKDTQFMQTINSHVPHLQSDEELLRQQEEFINKNRIHIQKRYARSPDRNRERSYSPPQRRDRYADNRDNRRGFGLRGRGRRASSRDGDGKLAKRRRSSSPDRKRDKDRNEEPEDEETRVYRLEIEKQKEMREKILRDKEMRRRRAAEGKTQIEEPVVAVPDDQPPAKLKPIIVTESKIISLKKSKEYEKNVNAVQPTTKLSNSEHHHSSSGHFTTIKRTLPTAKILPEAKRNISEHLRKDSGNISTTAVVKPVIKNKISTKMQLELLKDDSMDDYEDDDLLDEERLLADTPSPPDSPQLDDTDNDSDDIDDFEDDGEPEPKKLAKGFMSANRKVVLKSSVSTKRPPNIETKPIKTTSTSAAARSKEIDSKRRIFERLERKKIGINENSKRRIQRIFITKVE